MEAKLILTFKQALALRKQLRKNLSNFKTACRTGAMNMSLSEKIEMERNFKEAIQRTYRDCGTAKA